MTLAGEGQVAVVQSVDAVDLRLHLTANGFLNGSRSEEDPLDGLGTIQIMQADADPARANVADDDMFRLYGWIGWLGVFGIPLNPA